jgi:ATP-dependent Clp protease adaptor protein ClpS
VERPAQEDNGDQREAKLRATAVVVLDDPVNLRTYVALVLAAKLDIPAGMARAHARAVGQDGRSVVWSGERGEALQHLLTLRRHGINVCLERS